jgi:mannitol/fructose-specific phosphotransferase system IIA component (Ntr-type)
MSVSEVSGFLFLSPASVYELAGELRAVRVDGRWHFRTMDVEEWLLKQRSNRTEQLEPVRELGARLRLSSSIDEANVFLDVDDRDASTLIRNAIHRARLDLTHGPESAARQEIYESFLEREALCSTALHPDVAFPHPRDPEKCPFAADAIVVVRARQPVEFASVNGYRPRIVFLLFARTVSLQLHWEARLSHLLHREGFVRDLLSAESARAVCALFER